jgi:hypothetical protein
MTTSLTEEDYVKILTYYKKNIPNSKKLLKLKAEKILRNKLCRCIKKLDPVNEARSIGICSKSVLNSKGATHGKFNCTGKKPFLILQKFKHNTKKKNPQQKNTKKTNKRNNNTKKIVYKR